MYSVCAEDFLCLCKGQGIFFAQQWQNPRTVSEWVRPARNNDLQETESNLQRCAAKKSLKRTNCIRNTLEFFSQLFQLLLSYGSQCKWKLLNLQWEKYFQWASMLVLCDDVTGSLLVTMKWHFAAVISIVSSNLFSVFSSFSFWTNVW